MSAQDVPGVYRDRPNVLLSIDPEYAEAILDGEKRFEYRRTVPDRHPPYREVLYATAPVSAAIGAAYVGNVLAMRPIDLVDATVDGTEHDSARVLEYFEGTDFGYAQRIDSTERFDLPLSREHLCDFGHEPSQNFRYMEPVSIPEEAVHV